ncbi:MAG: site-specific DNA-methyltransferase, partial [Bellilinea sp.]
MEASSGISVWHGDCFEMMDQIEPQSVDAIITDPPYGTTALAWDHKINLDAWWTAATRVIKPSGVIAMFSV